MPIPPEELYRSFVVVAPDATVGQVLRQMPQDRGQRVWTYVVMPVEGGRYLAVLWRDVERSALKMGGDLSRFPFNMLEDLPEPIEAAEQSSTSKQAARDLRDAQPGRCLVVLSEGKVIGLLYEVSRAVEPLGEDPFAIAKGPPDFSGPIVLGEEELPAGAEPPPEAAAGR
jgi:hypothetical protein